MEGDGGISAEVTSRYGNSAAPDSKQVIAVLQAVTDIIKAEGLPVTPTSLFAATMSALENPDAQASPEVRGEQALGVCIQQAKLAQNQSVSCNAGV